MADFSLVPFPTRAGTCCSVLCAALRRHVFNTRVWGESSGVQMSGNLLLVSAWCIKCCNVPLDTGALWRNAQVRAWSTLLSNPVRAVGMATKPLMGLAEVDLPPHPFLLSPIIAVTESNSKPQNVHPPSCRRSINPLVRSSW